MKELTHFSPIFYFYTPWKRQKAFGLGIEMNNIHINKMVKTYISVSI